MQIPTGAEAFHSDPPPPVPFPLSGLPPYLSPFPPVILHVHHLLPPPTSPSLDFPHTCPPYRPPRKDKVVEDLDQDHQQELKPPPVGTTASSSPPLPHQWPHVASEASLPHAPLLLSGRGGGGP